MPDAPPDIATFTLGDYQTNCYVVSDPASKDCWFVDAGQDPGDMIAHVREMGLTPKAVVLTHAHVDHIAGLAQVLADFPGLEVMIHEDEWGFPEDATKNLSMFLASPVEAPPATRKLTHGETLTLGGGDGGLAFEVRHTPGHSPGGITLVQVDAELALVGDALFAGAIGRFDFPTSDGRALIAGIHREIMTLPDDFRVLSGHGPETTVGRERAGNPYLRESGLE